MAIRDNVPSFVAEVAQMARLMAAEQPEIDRIDGRAESTLGDFFVASFTAMTASAWEKFMGFAPAPAWPIERRRERIRARLLSVSPMSKDDFKRIVENAAGTQVEITEQIDDGTITVKFVGIYGVSPYLDDIKAELERIRPYHLPIIYEWIYVKHSQLTQHTYAELAAYTHESIRTGGTEA